MSSLLSPTCAHWSCSWLFGNFICNPGSTRVQLHPNHPPAGSEMNLHLGLPLLAQTCCLPGLC